MSELIITNGDSAAALLREAGYRAEILPWRDILHDGPVPKDTDLEELSAIRAAYLSQAFDIPLEDVQGDFRKRDETLSRHASFDRVTLWFEHDLYDQLQLLQLLDFFHRQQRPSPVSLIQADDYLGRQSPESIRQFEARRAPVSEAALSLASDLFAAFREPSPTALATFLTADLAPLPFMQQAIRRLLEELPSRQNGLSRTQRQILVAIRQENLPPKRLFGASQAMEEAIFMGDWSFWRCLDELVFNQVPLLQGPAVAMRETRDEKERQRYLDAKLSLTETGDALLSGSADHAVLNRIDRWLGGTHLDNDSLWRWDREADAVLPPS
jgi:hypothetical protein